MLEKFRAMSQTWVAKVLLALITIPFALFGVEYYFRQTGGGADAVAKVDGYTITQSEFNESLRNQLDRMQAGLRGAKVDPALIDTPEVRYEALDALINRRLLTVYGDRNHLAVPDSLLVNEISQVEAFRDNGKFSRAQYEAALRARGMTPAAFESRLRDDLKIQLEQEALTTTQWVPRVSIDAFLELNDQSREIAVSEILVDAFYSRTKIDDAAVKQYYETHQDQFKVPERVKIQYLVLSADQLAQQVEVTQEELRKAFSDPASQARWQGQETRRASHILIAFPPKANEAQRSQAQALAQKVLGEVKAHPDQFAQLAKQYSQDPGSAAQGGDLGYFGRGMMTQPFEAAAFSMKPGEIRGPVETEFGFHIIKLTDVKTGKGKSLEEVTPQLIREIRKQRATQLYADSADTFSNLVYEQSGSLKPAAEKLKLTPRDSGWITWGEISQDLLLNNAKLRSAIFAAESVKDGRNTPAVEVAPNTLVSAHVTAYEAAVVRPFPEVKASIEHSLQQQEAARLAKLEGEARLAELKEGKPVDLKWTPARRLTRQQALAGGLPGTMVTQAFQADPTRLPAYAGAVLPTGTYALMRITEVIPGNPEDDTKRKQAETGLTRAYGDQVLSGFISGLRHDASIRLVNKAALERRQGDR